jgi:hypothetical protein
MRSFDKLRMTEGDNPTGEPFETLRMRAAAGSGA